MGPSEEFANSLKWMVFNTSKVYHTTHPLMEPLSWTNGANIQEDNDEG